MITDNVSLSQLSSDFSKVLGVPISAFVKHHQLAKTPKAFLQQSDQFKLIVSKGDPQLYVQNCQQDSEKSASTPTQFTPSTLQIVCVGTAKHLLKQQAGETIAVASLASTFRQQHGKAMKTVLSNLGLAQNVPQFLQSCEGIVLRREQNAWLISLAPECHTD